MGHPRHRAGILVAVATLAAGCSTGNPPEDDRTPSAESAALRVQTVSGAERLDEQTRTEIEGEVGNVLSDYVFEAFLGDYPRDEFVQSFEAFTSDAALEAAGDIDDLTAATAADATAVRATELDARLSFLTRGGQVYAGSAAVHFAFEATFEDGSTRPLVLDGRILLDDTGDSWRIFGYDVALDNGIPVDVQTESEDGS